MVRKNPLDLKDDEWVRYCDKIFSNMKIFSLTTKRAQPIQIDILAFYDKYCILAECKTGGGEYAKPVKYVNEFIEKIKKIGKNDKERKKYIIYYLKKHNLTKKLEKFNKKFQMNIKEKDILKFSNIIYLYIHNRFIPLEFRGKEFNKKIKINFWDIDDVEYYRVVSSAIGEFARYEIFPTLDIEFNEFKKDEKEKFKILQVDEPTIDEKYYIFEISPLELIKRAYVLRNPTIGWRGKTYQRIVKKDRLREIAKFYLALENRQPNFITSIIVQLGKDAYCLPDGNLVLPKKHNSVVIVDGQHRLYGFCKIMDVIKERNIKNKNLAEKLLTQSKLIVSGFKGPIKKQARIFIDINQNQRKVSKDILYETKWSVLEERDSESLSNALMNKLNEHGPFKGIIQTNPLSPNPLKKISIIEYGGLKRMIEYTGSGIFAKKFAELKKLQMADLSKEDKEKYFQQYLDHCARYINRFFDIIKEKFKDEFEDRRNEKYALISVVGISSLLRLLEYFLTKNLDWNEIKNYIKILKEESKFSFLKDKIPTSGSKWSDVFVEMLCMIELHKGGFIEVKKLSTPTIKKVIRWFLNKEKKEFAESIVRDLKELPEKLEKINEDEDLISRLKQAGILV